MRGLPVVLTLAFVFASSALLVGPASAQTSEPDRMPPESGDQPTDAVLQGRVTDQAGNPVAGASVSAYSYGPVEPGSAGSGSGSDGSTSSRPASCCYGSKSAVTDGDGRYRIDVHSGQNQVSVWRDGYAQAYLQVPIASGETATQDVTLQKFPEKTARIEGRVTDARDGRGLGFASLSVGNPFYGTHACSMAEGQDGSGGGSQPKPMPAEDSQGIVAPDYQGPSCDITVHPDGRFEGLVTPGYSTVTVSAYDPSCYQTFAAEGGSSSDCGPQFFTFSRTLTLPANGTTVLNVALRTQAAPDAVVSGYLVDAETGEAIPGATISFSNQETYGYGWATTDGDGSYALRLRSGYHTVSVYAPDHLPWEGVLLVGEGETPFDVELVPGQAAYGGWGCCIAYAEARDASAAPGMAAAPASGGGAGEDADLAVNEAAQRATSGETYDGDLGGGLGPYDASRRASTAAEDGDGLEDAGNGIPAAGLLATLAAVGLAALAVALRRRA